MGLGVQEQAGGFAGRIVEAAAGDAAEVAGIADASVDVHAVAADGNGGGAEVHRLDALPILWAIDSHGAALSLLRQWLCRLVFALDRRF